MKLILLTAATLVATPTITMGFVATTSTSAASSTKTALSMTSTHITNDLFPLPQPEQRRRKMSTSIPFLECPAALHNSDLAGNVGFDPMHFSKTKKQLWEYREAEIKHARLAMLVSIRVFE